MSLDVKLYRERYISYDKGKKYTIDIETIYSANITHNLGNMAKQAGIYEALWRPYRLKENYKDFDDTCDDEFRFEDQQTIFARDIIPLLEKGLVDLKKRPKYFETFNSPNHWGLYEHFVPFVENYLDACKKYPDTTVEVSR